MRRWLLLGLLAAGCASGGGAQSGSDESVEDYDQSGFSEPGRGESLPSVTYEGTAEKNWARGEAAFEDEDYLAAQRYYAFIKNKFPYSRFAVLAEVRIGDCQFERGRHLEAIDTYQSFVRIHPTHQKVPYAVFRTGSAYYEQIPTDWFLLPPSEEKDQAAVRDAERVLADYVARFPKDPNISKGKSLLDDVRRRLMAHERYVADFYRRLGKDKAYVGRLETIRNRFPDVGLTAKLLLEMTKAYVRMGEADKAKALVTEMEQKFPGAPEVTKAKKLLEG